MKERNPNWKENGRRTKKGKGRMSSYLLVFSITETAFKKGRSKARYTRAFLSQVMIVLSSLLIGTRRDIRARRKSIYSHNHDLWRTERSKIEIDDAAWEGIRVMGLIWRRKQGNSHDCWRSHVSGKPFIHIPYRLETKSVIARRAETKDKKTRTRFQK